MVAVWWWCGLGRVKLFLDRPLGESIFLELDDDLVALAFDAARLYTRTRRSAPLEGDAGRGSARLTAAGTHPSEPDRKLRTGTWSHPCGLRGAWRREGSVAGVVVWWVAVWRAGGR